MDGVQFDINMVTGGSGGAIDSIVAGLTNITGHLNTLNQNFISFSQRSTSGFTQLNSQVQQTESRFEKLGKASFFLNNISQGLSGITNDLNNAVEPGIKFNASLKDAQAISGATEQQINKLGESARNNAKEFGIDAAQGVETYKIYLSKLGPELANNEKAMEGFGRNSSILSKQLKGDTVGATELLTTAMNQYGVSIKDPIEAMKTSGIMMNIMSAAAQEGSAELPQIKNALEESGMMAKTANVSFTELNSAIQVLDKAGKKGAEGGVAIRNVLAEISQGNMMPRQQLAMLHAAGIDVEKLGDKSLSFSNRLKVLTPIVNDNAAMVKLFGKENVAAGIALVQGANEIDRFTGKIGGTNSAVDMATTVMGSYEERMKRTMAKVHDFGISIFKATESFLPFITIGMGTLQVMANMALAGNLVSSVIGSTFVKSLFNGTAITTVFTAAQAALNFVLNLNPIFLIVTGIGLLITGFAIAYNKSETFRAGIWGIIEVGKLLSQVFIGVGKTITGALTFDTKMMKEGFVQVATTAAEIAQGGISKAFNKGFDESISESKRKAAMEKAGTAATEDITAKIDLAIPGITQQGVANKGSVLEGYDPHKKKKKTDKEGHELASNITAGGSRPTTIHLTIQKVIGIGEVKTTNMVGTAKEAGKQVVDEVLMALQSVQGKISVQ